MSWQAPNLLDKIFAKPDVGEGSTLGNFMGGYVAGADRAAKKRAENSPQPDSGADSETNGGASGDSGTGNPLPTSTSHPGGDGNWMADWFKSTLHGEAEAKNIVAYESAQTSQVAQQARTVGQVLQNQGARWMMDNNTQDQATMAQWMQDNSSLDSLLNAPLPELRTPQAQTMALNAKKGAAQTLFGQATITRQSGLLAQAAKLVGAGFDIPVDPKTGLPDSATVAAAGQKLDARNKEAEIEKQSAIEERQLAVANARGDKAVEVANVKGEWSLKNTDAKVKLVADQAAKFLGQAQLKSFNEELISTRERMRTETDDAKVEAAFSKVISKYGMADKIKIGAANVAPSAKTLTSDIAQQLLQKAGGDKDKARKMAKEQGYSF